MNVRQKESFGAHSFYLISTIYIKGENIFQKIYNFIP